ncbi:hypothetical protein MTO96_031309 [Rhipicephalus appendiculatus]
MLKSDEERHVERLGRLESTIFGMRDALIQRIRSINPTSEIIAKALEYNRVIREDMAAVKTTDMASQRGQKKMIELRNFLWDTFERLQNPTDCKTARKLLCNVSNPDGFGSGSHDFLWCFVAALQMGRTLILDTSKWHYTPYGNSWRSVFQPLTGSSCDSVGIDDQTVILDTRSGSCPMVSLW